MLSLVTVAEENTSLLVVFFCILGSMSYPSGCVVSDSFVLPLVLLDIFRLLLN